ncbi:outer membrane beta-barrel protein [Flavobacterium sp. NST-5]|uniref:Outer membrane beta-barrel protein n=1 Tax=Flavobacterium ichthyis TaxID=2698827 RepID=A0ABW9Z9X3_9FLAO|nr:porin family protein [Flavobacterium ichthyis]NBL64910.1 outer membrane beta-barrel protein [Flavobacterium ichthyis]
MKPVCFFLFLFCSATIWAQDPVTNRKIKEQQEREQQERLKEIINREQSIDTTEISETRRRDSLRTTVTVVDSLYREDQFYIGLTYNWLQNNPSGVKQNSFSTGLHLGFMRDIPINKRRNVAFALGLGYSLNDYRQNLKINDIDGARTYEVIDESEVDFDKNKFALHFVELPIEFRWRSSTVQSHRFWRIYAGFKMSYLFLNKSKFVADGEKIRLYNNDDFNEFRYGTYISFGYNTWNFHAYYGLNEIFKNSARVNGNPIEMQTINIGLMFYIL